ncbi:MAG: Ger(x)C family spore germination protein [Christensenellales bacterium]|jgi:spore germination protein KC
MKGKPLTLIAICLVLAVSLTGCWSYHGLNEMAIVLGMAIDRDYHTGIYFVSCEIADLAESSSDTGLTSKVVEAQGRTLLEAVRNAKRRLLTRLYFGNMEVIILGEDLLREGEIRDVLNFGMRDIEIRETTHLMIAMGVPARDIIRLRGLDQPIVSLELETIVDRDNELITSSINVELRKAYDALNSPGMSLVLPAIHIVTNDGEEVAESNGIGLFMKETLVGFISPEDSQYFLFATDRAHGGMLPMAIGGDGLMNYTFEIGDSDADIQIHNKEGALSFELNITADLYLLQVPEGFDIMKRELILELERAAGANLAGSISRVISDVQKQYQTDVFGFGEVIYKKRLQLWRNVEDMWMDLFPEIPIDVHCTLTFRNTEFTLTKESFK